MEIFLFLAVVAAISFWFAHQDTDNITAVLICTLSIIALLMLSITLPFARMDYRAQEQAFIATTQAVERARRNPELLETAALQLDIVKTNRWLARAQYMNTTVFDIFIPDSVEQLEPIQ